MKMRQSRGVAAILAALWAASCVCGEAVEMAEGKVLHVGGREAVVEIFDAQPLVRNWCSESFGDQSCFDNPMPARLRKQEKLEAVCAGQTDEFRRQVLLMDWTFRRMPHFGPPTHPELSGKPLEILASVDAGGAFNCGYYADVCSAALRSFGYVVRSIGLKGAKSDGNGSGHSVLEVWSNRYRKWVLLDPTLNIYFTDPDGVPLNAYEIRQRWFYRKGEGLSIVIGPEGVKKTVADMPIPRGTHPGFGTLMIRPESLGKFLYIAWEPQRPDGRPDYGKMFIFKDKLCEGVEFHTRRCPQKPDVEPYYPVQQASLSVERCKTGASTLIVSAATLTPDFKTMEYRVDDGAWTPGAERLDWPLHVGVNSLEVRAVNRFDLAGRASKIVLKIK